MRILIATLIAGMATAFVPAFAEGPLESQMTAWSVALNEVGEETLTEIEEVAPGELVEYQLVYENVGETALQGLVVSAPVPAATIFEMGSANTQVPGIFEASADDGVSWGTPPLLRQGDNGTEEVPVEEYDLVRWVPQPAIDKGESWTFKYRVAVE